MIKSLITLKHLEALVCVVDMGSFRKAAAVLGTTQPNISNRIAALEAGLGVVLMHRDAGSVRLTQKGEALVLSARRVLWSAEAFLETAARKDLIHDRMRLGVTEVVACTWLHAFLRRFRANYPAINVELQVNLSTEIEKDLAAGQLDLTLQTGPFQHETSGTIALGTYPYAWVATPAIARALGSRLADVLKGPVLVHAKHSLAAKALQQAAAASHLAVDQVVFSSSLAACLQMAEDGMGVTLLPEAMIGASLIVGRLVRVPCDWLPAPLEFFARFDKAKMPRFIAAAAEMAAEVAKDHKELSPLEDNRI
jgi:DNA-binding transcriptional LysR family regulator